MKRKRYQKLLRCLVTRIWTEGNGEGCGKALRSVRDTPDIPIAKGLTYQEAWDNMLEVRRLYGME